MSCLARRALKAAAVLALFPLVVAGPARAAVQAENAHAFSFTAIEGDALPMSRFAGKPVLVVNTASRCGYTPQYKGLQTLYERYRERGLVVLGVPSNDFRQELDENADIKQFCEAEFGVTFPMTEKQHVKGAQAHPLFRWMVQRLGPEAEPAWNFHKVLLDPQGKPVAAWPSRVKPLDQQVTSRIEAVLAAR